MYTGKQLVFIKLIYLSWIMKQEFLLYVNHA